MEKCKILIFAVLCLIIPDLYGNNLDLEYYTSGRIEKDILSRNLEQPISYLESCLPIIETDTLDGFCDSIYVDMSIMLSTAYTLKDNIGRAESTLKHAIDYFVNTGRKSKIYYLLYNQYGALMLNIRNYYQASVYLGAVVNVLRNDYGDEKERMEHYATSLAMLAESYCQLNQFANARGIIDEAVRVHDKLGNFSKISTEILFCHVLGVSMYDLYRRKCIINDNNRHRIDQLLNRDSLELCANYLKKAYSLSLKDQNAQFFALAITLSSFYCDINEFDEALKVLYGIEHFSMMDRERMQMYNNLYTINLALDNENESVKYAKLYSDLIKKVSVKLHQSLSGMTIERTFYDDALSLVNVSAILEKFPTNQDAIALCYNNNLFMKEYMLKSNMTLHTIAKGDKKLKNGLEEIKELRTRMFAGEEDLREQLRERENVLLQDFGKYDDSVEIKVRTLQDVQKSLSDCEYSIEFISYLDSSQVIRYGAIVTSNQQHPTFVRLSSFHELQSVMLNSYKEQTIGINNLYLKGQDNVLYHLLLEKIEPLIKDATTVFLSPKLGLNNINFEWIPCPDGTYFGEKHKIRIVSSSSVIICDNNSPIDISSASIFGGINYTDELKAPNNKQNTFRNLVLDEINDSTRASYAYLKGTAFEVDSIYSILGDHCCKTAIFKGADATETSFRNMDGNSPSIIHVATHGFYLVGSEKHKDYFNRLNAYSEEDNFMLLSGILFSGSAASFVEADGTNPLTDGVITSEEISGMDLSKTQVAILSACNSGIGSAGGHAGIGGLPLAFKQAGVKYVVASLWEVHDISTVKLMTYLYQNMLSGMEIHSALHNAQIKLASEYPDPYYWASFFVIE